MEYSDCPEKKLLTGENPEVILADVKETWIQRSERNKQHNKKSQKFPKKMVFRQEKISHNQNPNSNMC